MKRLLSIVLAFSVAVACEMDPVTIGVDGNIIDSKEFNFMLYESESELLDMNPNQVSCLIHFAISKPWEITSDSWISASVYSGYGGNHDVRLYFEKNLTGSDREGYVTFTSEGGEYKLKVSQKKLDQEYYEIGPEGGEIRIPVSGNIRYDSVSSYWYEAYYDENEGVIVISVTENNSSDRTADIWMNGYSERNVVKNVYNFHILQQGKEALRIGKFTYTDWDGTVKEVTDNMSPIGLFLYGYPGAYSDGYYNVKASYVNGSWTFPYEITLGVIDNNNIYAYYPYTSYFERAVEVQTYKYEDNPVMYAWGSVDWDRNVVDFNLEQMMSRIIFHMSIPNDYPYDVFVNGFSIDNGDEVLPTTGYIQSGDGKGKISLLESSYSSNLHYDYPFEIVKGEMNDVVFYSIPNTNIGSVTLSFSVEGYDYAIQEKLPIDEFWQQGKTYEYTFTLNLPEKESVNDFMRDPGEPGEAVCMDGEMLQERV